MVVLMTIVKIMMDDRNDGDEDDDVDDNIFTFQFLQGDYQKSEITGRLEPHYPSWKRNIFRYCVSMPVMALGLCTVFVVMFACFEFQRWVNSMENPPKPLKFAPKIALAVCIGLMEDNFKKVAYKLNDKGINCYCFPGSLRNICNINDSVNKQYGYCFKKRKKLDLCNTDVTVLSTEL